MKNKCIIIVAIFLLLLSCQQTKKEILPENKTNMETTDIFDKGNPLPGDWFSGSAFLFPLVATDKNNEFSAGSVTFAPGARTNWHTHPKGQVLIVIDGHGFYQEKGKAAQAIKKGDVVNIPEDVVHWHGANDRSHLVHIAITNVKDEQLVTWLQPVTDEEYKEVNK